jgi:hypothetical protein
MTKARHQRRANAQKTYDCLTKEQNYLLNDKNYLEQSQKLARMLLEKTNDLDTKTQLDFCLAWGKRYTTMYIEVVKRADDNMRLLFTAELFIEISVKKT